jgi:hypothetical protein
LRFRPTFEGRKQPSVPRFHQAATEYRDVSRADGFNKLLKDATMVRLPAWDTPAWRLARELRPLYAEVNRFRDLEATPGASLEEIAAARRAIAAAAVELTRLVDAMRLFEAFR